jgi:hypothetical protein
MDLTRLKQIKDQQAQDADKQRRHTDLLLDNNKTQETIVKSFSLLVDYLKNNTSKTEVVNQLREINTPDVRHVVSAVDSLHSTLKKQEKTDLSEITTVLKGVLDEAKKIPKELPKAEKLEVIDYSKQLKALEETVKAVEKAVKDQQIKVEAPVVNVPETEVNVEAPDLSPVKDSVEKSSKEVVKAVKGISIPEFKTDPIEKLLKKTNKLLEDLPDLMPSGGGGAGRVSPYSDSSDLPSFVTLEADGSIPVSTKDFKVNDIEEDTTSYYGKSKANGDYLIQKVTATSVSYATESNNGSVTSYTDAWTNKLTLTYGRYDQAF